MNEIIIYGAGKRGKECLDYMKWRGIDGLCKCIADKNYINLTENGRDSELGKDIVSPDSIVREDLPVIVAVYDNEDILENLTRGGVSAYSFDEFYKAIGEDRAVHVREYLAYIHARKNDGYFKFAEEQANIDIFWKEGSLFLDMFKKLDLGNVIELACGWGRHVPNYYDMAKKITLVDILQENIDICRKRFVDYDKCGKISYYKNNGFNYGSLETEKYTAVFSYDAMVHFEMLDVYSYLCDTYRVLRKGGMALFQHSNYGDDPKADFQKTPGARNYMTKDLFEYLTYRSGLEIVEQKVIDWAGFKDLDCVTLLRKG